jgi:ribosomal protein L40E
MITMVKHEHERGQYVCLTCGSKNASIAGEAVAWEHVPRHTFEQAVANIYQGACEECNARESASKFLADLRAKIKEKYEQQKSTE